MPPRSTPSSSRSCTSRGCARASRRAAGSRRPRRGSGSPEPRETLLLEGLDIQTDQALAGESPATLGDAWGVEPRERWGTIVTPDATREIARARGDWPAFYRRAVAAVRDGTAMPVDPHSALATLQVLESARRSAETGTVVEL